MNGCLLVKPSLYTSFQGKLAILDDLPLVELVPLTSYFNDSLQIGAMNMKLIYLGKL